MIAPPSPSPSPSGTGVLSSITDHIPSWLGPISGLAIAVITWLLLPQNVVGGSRWLIRWWQRRRGTLDKRRAGQRARFAGSIAAQVARVSELEEWRDERFAEMDAEVEVHGRQRRKLFQMRRRETIRRVPSLSQALQKSSDQIALLEGEPGSGKSVALRHVAMRMAYKVKEHPSETAIIPIYLNLKEFRPNTAVDAGAVRDFIRTSINRTNDRYVEMFLDQEFDRGIEDGSWLLLFDSFDEIPAVLGAVDADEVIEQYANALYDFQTGLNACRGIIASREFRGPRRISWPRFRVLRLTEAQRQDLVERLDLPLEVERRILAGLATAEPAVRQLADNPLFLALLCEHQRDEAEFPRNSHVVFENYVAKRFRDDRERLVRRFGLTSDAVRRIAEQAAYCMSAQHGLGLSPARNKLIEGIQSAGFTVSGSTGTALSALEYLRLARAEASTDSLAEGFTFAHRRFQEYFATCLVIREPTRVAPISLLTDGRWRETAVTLFQTQDQEAIRPLLKEAERLLTAMTVSIEELANDADEEELANDADEAGKGDLPKREPPKKEAQNLSRALSVTPFDWPGGSLHLLGLLQDGFPSGDQRRSQTLGALAGRLLKTGYSHGQIHDRRWAIEVCLAAELESACDLLRAAFKSGSGWLREAAYAQVGRLETVPDDLRNQIRSVLAGLAAGGRLRQQRLAVDAQLQRLPNSHPERLLRRLFVVAPFVDGVLWATLAAVLIAITDTSRFLPGVARTVSVLPVSVIPVAVLAIIGHSTFYFDRDARRLGGEGSSSGTLAWFYSLVETIAGSVRPRTLASMALQMRFFVAAFLALGIFISWRFNLLTEILILTAMVFLVAWGPAAVRADLLLEKPNLIGISLLPFEWLRATGRRASRQGLIIAGVMILLVAAWAVIVVWFTSVFSHIPTWVGFFGLLIPATFVVVSISAMLRNLRYWWLDRRALTKADHGGIPYDDFDGMFAILIQFRTRRAILLFVQEVKRQRIVAECPGALRAMQAFVAAARSGNITSSHMSTMGLKPSEVAEVQRWAADTEGAKHRVTIDLAIIDEVGKITADIELTRLASAQVGKAEQ
jgi:hypothetical protein